MSKKNRVTQYLKPADIIFIANNSGNFISDGIQYMTDSKWTHVFLYHKDGKGYHYTYPRAKKGVVDDFCTDHHIIVVKRIQAIDKKDRKQIIREAQKDVFKTKLYNARAFFGRIFTEALRKIGLKEVKEVENKWASRKRGYVCNSGVRSWIKRGLNVDPLPSIEEGQDNPGDLYRSGYLNVILRETC